MDYYFLSFFLFGHCINPLASSDLSQISTFLLISMDRYLCWCTNMPKGIIDQQLALPQSQVSLADFKINLPQSQVTLADFKINLPQSQVTLADFKINLPQSQVTLADFKINLPQSQVTLADFGNPVQNRWLTSP